MSVLTPSQPALVPLCPGGCGAANWELRTVARIGTRTGITIGDDGKAVVRTKVGPLVVTSEHAECQVCGYVPGPKAMTARALASLRLLYGEQDPGILIEEPAR